MSSIQLGVSRRDGRAKLYPITIPVDPTYRHDIRARARIVWYGWGSDHAVIGRASHEVDWYRHVYRSEDFR